MKLFNTAAIIVLAGAGLVAQEQLQPQTQTQSYVEQFQAIQPTLESLWSNMAYQEIIDKVEAILPATAPEFNNDPEEPNIGMNSYFELTALQSLYVYLGRAYGMNGNYEKAVSSFQKAEEIANLSAVEMESVIPALIDQWNMEADACKKRLESFAALMKQKEELEAKGNQINEQEKEFLAKITQNVPGIEKEKLILESQVERAPLVIAQLEEMLNGIRSDSGKFAPVIDEVQKAISNEKETIDTKFSGDKAKYANSVIGTKENLEALKSQTDKVKFLNRLLFLDPKSEAVKKQLNIVLGRS